MQTKEKVMALSLASVLALSFAFPIAAAFATSGGSVSLPLNHPWFSYYSPYAPPAANFGKVIYNTPSGTTQLTLTYILQNAAPNTEYTVGFDVTYASNSGTFGQLTAVLPGSGWVYVVGTITTGAYGDGSAHINIDGISSGNYQIIFWVIPYPPASYGWFPIAATGSWDLGQFTTISF